MDFQSVEDWFKVVTTEDEQSVAISLDVEASASLGSEVPFFAKLLFKLKGVFKNSSSQKTTIRETLKKEFTRMKGDINLLLGDGLKKLRKKFPNYKGFLVIVDNLDAGKVILFNVCTRSSTTVSQRSGEWPPIASPICLRSASHSSSVRAGHPGGTMK